MRKKLLIGLATLAGMIAIPIAVHAGFSPANRATFQCITPTNCPGANHVVFNSFTNAPNYGDERAFVDAKDATNTSAGGYLDNLSGLHDGQKIVMRVYIHNNANPAAIGDAAATAKNTRMQLLLPTSQKTSNEASASVSADNANPGTVSDTVDFAGSNPFSLTFDRTVQVQVTYRPNGTGDFVTRPLPGATFANDQTLNANFGDWHGCFNYAALVTVTVVVHMPTPPPIVSFACTGLDVVEVDRTHFNFTAHAAVQNASVTSYTFTAKDAKGNVVDTKTVTTNALSAPYTFTNSTPGTYTISAVVNTDHGSTKASDCVKSVSVKETPPPNVKFACTGLESNQVSDTSFKFTAHGTAENAVISSYAFVAKDANGNTVDTKTVNTGATSADYAFNQSNPGDYTISAVVNTDHGSTNPADCVKTVTVKHNKIPAVCSSLSATLGTKRSVTVGVNITPVGAVPTAISYDFGDGTTPLLTDKTTVDHTYAKDGTYTIAATATFDESKDQLNTSRCVAKVTITTPVTPVVLPATTTPLPNTGPGDVVELFAGVSGLGAAGHFMVARRRR